MSHARTYRATSTLLKQWSADDKAFGGFKQLEPLSHKQRRALEEKVANQQAKPTPLVLNMVMHKIDLGSDIKYHLFSVGGSYYRGWKGSQLVKQARVGDKVYTKESDNPKKSDVTITSFDEKCSAAEYQAVISESNRVYGQLKGLETKLGLDREGALDYLVQNCEAKD